MNLLDHFRGMMKAEAEANRRALESLDSVPLDGRDSPSFQRALEVMAHIQLARHVWLERLHNRAIKPLDWFPPQTVSATRDDSRRLDALWTRYLDSLTDANLADECSYTSSEGVRYTSLVHEILAHVLNHSTYHRGQVARFVTESGGNRAQTDLIAFTRRSASASVSAGGGGGDGTNPGARSPA